MTTSFRKLPSVKDSFSNMIDGFSLVELVIIVVVVGLTSAIAVPVCSRSETKARLCEADARLVTLRTQLRIYYSKNGEYPIAATSVNVAETDWHDVQPTELNGKYFSDASFSYKSLDGENFTLRCAGGVILDSDRTIDESGFLNGGS